MTFQPGGNLYPVAFGTRPENVEVPHLDVRAPAVTDILYPVGKVWVDTVNNAVYTLTSLSTSSNITTANWVGEAGGSVDLSSLTGDTGTASPTAGNIKIAGTASQITTAASGSTVTVSLPAAITTPGSLTTTTTLTGGTGVIATTGNIVASTGNISSTIGSLSAATTVTAGSGVTSTTGNIVASAGNISATVGSVAAGTTVTAGTSITATAGAITANNGNLVFGTSGNKILSTNVATTTAAGANSFGKVTLASGTATVATTAVTANSIILLTRDSPGATGAAALGQLSIGTKVGATSFVINALTTADSTAVATTDVSSISWMIIN